MGEGLWADSREGVVKFVGIPACWELGWPQVGQDTPPPTHAPCSFSIEIDQKLQEIMKQTGYLTIGGQVLPFPQPSGGGQVSARLGLCGGTEARQTPSHNSPHQRYQAEINDLENLGEMGSGTCGQVWKMRFRKTGHIIAVKVSPHPTQVNPMTLMSGA